MLLCVAEFPDWRHYHLIWVRVRLPHASELFHHRKCRGEPSRRCWLFIQAATVFQIHFTNITHDNLWCHLTDVSLERSLTNNNILLILSTVLTTSSHLLTHTHLSEYGLKALAVSGYIWQHLHHRQLGPYSRRAIGPWGVLHRKPGLSISSVNRGSSFGVVLICNTNILVLIKRQQHMMSYQNKKRTPRITAFNWRDERSN